MHWAVPLLGVVEMLLGRSWVRLVGFAAIILVHEIGHAVLVKAYRLQVHALQIHPLGGECIHEATHSARTNVIIAWGGVLAQAMLLAAAVAAGLWLPAALSSPLVYQLIDVFTVSNAVMIALNLIPIRPLDGYTAWQLKHLRRKPKKLTPKKAQTKPKAKPAMVVDIDTIDSVVDDALEQARRTAKDQERS